MSDPGDDRILQDYLHRKSALSMGYRRVYIETPPPELDRAITARARRALRWLIPALLSALIGVGLLLSINAGVNKFMQAAISADKNLQERSKHEQEERERERLNGPVTVIIDPNSLAAPVAQLTREQWLAKIEALRRAGKKQEADAEQRRLRAAYPDPKK